jgi:hypothetical protein
MIFFAYKIVSGWNTLEKLSCPYYKEINKAFTLTNGGKTSFCYCHRQFLPTNHKYIKNKNFVGIVERDVTPQLLSGE